MKKLLTMLLGFLSILSISGCGKDQTPDNTTHGQRQSSEFTWQVVEPGKSPVQVYHQEVMISPTWGQSNKYASERGDYLVWQVIGFALLLLFVVVAYGAISEAKWFPNISTTLLSLLLFALAAGSLASFKWQSSSIRWNNDKWISKDLYDKSIKDSGSTKPIWDSLRKECKIVSGPYDCVK